MMQKIEKAMVDLYSRKVVVLLVLLTLSFGPSGSHAQNRKFQVRSNRKCKPVLASRAAAPTVNVDTLQDCKRRCKQTKSCMSFQFKIKNGECKTLTNWATFKRKKGADYKCGRLKFSYFGPVITENASSEVITIPQPPAPNTPLPSSNCPHLQNDLLDWHDETTWTNNNLVPPGNGDDVTLPSNQKVIINSNVLEALGVVIIPSDSELIFGQNTNGISFKAQGFDVQGTLTIGSETCTATLPVNIILSGTRPFDAVTNRREATYKGISVTGTISIHGKQFYRTWTRLAKTAVAGNDFVILQNTVNWQPGQEVVLVTTAVKDAREWHQNEVLIVDIVMKFKARSSIVYFTTPMQYTHYANNGFQGEAGLLSRIIKIQGADDDSEPTDPDSLDCVQSRWMWGGDTGVQCPDTELTGFGGHIMIHNGGKGYVEGVELYKMGQTNVLGRYPIHYHILGNDCVDCYFRSSSVHRSFYRCISIHGTNSITVSENVAYDVTGYCYYLEDGVEEDNTFSYNLVAHVHYLGIAAFGNGQTTELNYESPTLTLPADVTASGFYVTNVHNNIIGNSASGGWAGYAFPSLRRPIGAHSDVNLKPSTRTGLTIDGNTAHSTGWWWSHAAGFYFGGALYLEGDSLVYNAGRDQSNGNRSPCEVDHCASGNCDSYCASQDQSWVQLTNSKVFLVPGAGINSWSGRMEVIGYESHDNGLSLEALESGFWIDNMLSVCRTGESWIMPPNSVANAVKGNGFFWYDTGQEHIITNSKFRNCGYRSSEFDQYDTSPDRGCGDDADTGCNQKSSVFGFLTHSDQFNPESMQATKNIVFESCGRRYKLHDFNGDNAPSTVSGRLQNWLDTDGSATGQGIPTIIGSGQSEAGLWWDVDDEVVHDEQGPLNFIKKTRKRDIGHIRLAFDITEHDQVGSSICGNGSGAECPALGYIKHFGSMFANDLGLPVTANPDVAGLTGGYGWLLSLNNGAPRTLKLDFFEIHPDSILVLGIAYPLGTNVEIKAFASWCTPSNSYGCEEVFQSVGTPDAVRLSNGNTYHMDATGFLTVRLIMSPQSYTGTPDWIYPAMNTIGKWGNWYAIDRFSRSDVTLLKFSYGPYMTIEADCPPSSGNSAYCDGTPTNFVPTVCSAGYEQVAFDRCCKINNILDCVDA
mmetsp:Transcript_11766/g.14644  ORF Transcript_11766/g.14644 Transcript_11766/m.14644 type:complete len:1149 (-) Transcript_11766:779-4225(-)